MKTDSIHALDVRNVTLAYQAKSVLLNVSCTVPVGVMCALIGPNGAGKTSILKALVGLIKPITGVITIFGEPYAAVRSRVAYVPQRSAVDWDFPATVFDVVMMGRYQHIGWFRWPSKQDKDKVCAALAAVSMSAYAQRPIGNLSGGQQQRVFLARALVQEADMYLMDEPFVGVDSATEYAMVALLKQLRAEGKTIVIVHHDLHTVRSYFDWGVLINRALIASGPIDTVFTDLHVSTAYMRPLSHAHQGL
jgi:manganese/zinc/iron transport system ATP- binding protein